MSWTYIVLLYFIIVDLSMVENLVKVEMLSTKCVIYQ